MWYSFVIHNVSIPVPAKTKLRVGELESVWATRTIRDEKRWSNTWGILTLESSYYSLWWKYIVQIALLFLGYEEEVKRRHMDL